ncbi:MAG: sulfite exporter TauE/SafE family protein [Phycisphaerales bacterium JB038]
MLTIDVVVIILLVGLVAGVLGGLLGIGGSIIMIPALSILLSGQERVDQHLIQAAAMVVNVAVALPAALRHHKAGAVRVDIAKWMLPIALVTILIGVFLSDLFPAERLKVVFAAFLAYVALVNGWKLVKGSDRNPDPEDHAKLHPARVGTVASLMGLSAGLLGIGGGVIAVPAMQLFLRLPLRQCIATTAAVMCLSSPLGAAFKLYNLPEHGRSPWLALLIAAILVPTAVIGARIGAKLTHTLPLRIVRGVLTLLLIAASLRMSGLLSGMF